MALRRGRWGSLQRFKATARSSMARTHARFGCEIDILPSPLCGHSVELDQLDLVDLAIVGQLPERPDGRV